MSLSFLFDENDTKTFNLSNTNVIQLTTSTLIDISTENIWNDIQSFFNLQNSLILLVIICIVFFFCTLCFVFILIYLLKKKRLYKKQAKNYPFQMKNSSGLTSSLGNIIPTDKHFQNKPKHLWNEKRMTLSNTKIPLSINNDEIETVNEVLAMEERHGKVYYKVNFTGHSPDYTAWVCEEDLIPE